MSKAGILLSITNDLIDKLSGCVITAQYNSYNFDQFEYYARIDCGNFYYESANITSFPNDTVSITLPTPATSGSFTSNVLAANGSSTSFAYSFKIIATDITDPLRPTYFDILNGTFETSAENSGPLMGTSDFSVYEYPGDVVATKFPGQFIQNQSHLKINSTNLYGYSARNGATISSYWFVYGSGEDNFEYDPQGNIYPTVDGVAPLTFIIKDSRGYTASKTKEIAIEDWKAPDFDDTSYCERKYGNTSAAEGDIKINVTGTYSAIAAEEPLTLVNKPYIYFKFGLSDQSYVTNWIRLNPAGWYSQGAFTITESAFYSYPTASNPMQFAQNHKNDDIFITFIVNDELTVPSTAGSNPDNTFTATIKAWKATIVGRKDKVIVNVATEVNGDFSWTPSTTQVNKVWKTDSNGTPGWRDENPGGVTSVNNKTGAVTLNASDVGAPTTSDLTTHTGNGDIHVTTSNKSTWDAKYNKPSGGIPNTDLANGTTLTNAVTHMSNSTIHVTSSDKTNWNDKIASTEKGAVNGVATLGSNGKIPMSQLDDAITGNVRFQDVWNASTNTPTLPSLPSFSDKGKYWITTVGGTFQGVTYNVGDWILASWTGDESTGTGSWRRVPNTDAVSSVDGLTGAVVLNDIKYTTQSLTAAQQSQARTNIGAGTSNFGGSYNDLTNKPTNVSSFTNDAGYLTQHQSLANYSTTSQMNSAISAHHDSTKQDTISDLSTIRSGASAGATAVQPATLNNYSTTSQMNTAISNHHDSTKQDSINSSSSVSVGQLTAYSGLSYVATGGNLVNVETAIDSKQATISDLSTIRSGASAGATAVQPAALNSYSTTAQMNAAISAYHDSTKQDSINSSSSISVGQLTAYNGLSYVPSGGSPIDVETAMNLKANTSDLPVANPGGGTTTLTSLKVGNTTYNIPQGGGTVITELFVVTYGTTSHADILSAKNASKEVICMGGSSGYTNIIFRLESIASAEPAVFTAIGNDNRVYSFSVLTNNTYGVVTASARAAVMDTWYSDGSQTYGSSYPVFARWTTVGSVSVLDFIATVSGTTGASAYDVRTHRAIKDGDGNNIASTYATKTELSAHHDSTKQDTISDLSTIRSGASAGATAVQPATLNNYSTTSQMNTAISDHHDSTKQDTINSSSSISVGQLTAYNGLSYVATGGGLVDVETAINSKYTKDANGIPESDLTAAVQAKLNAVAGYDEQRGLVTESNIQSGQMKYITEWIPSSEFLGTISITNTLYHKELYFKYDSYTGAGLIPYQRTKIGAFTLMPLMYVAKNTIDDNVFLRIGIRQDTVPINHIVSMHIPNATARYLRSSAALESGGYYTVDESDLVT